uniref:Uncharacterized protein n=1 Tax=Theropithecus gelada TaxID=9565 RepID=A0A8D2ELB1_THEGE
GKGQMSQRCPSKPSSRALYHRPSGQVSGAPVLSWGFLGPSPSSGWEPTPPGSSVGARGRTKAPMAVAWPERSSCSWRRPRRYRYSMRSTSERGRPACCRNSARTRASAPGFPRPARSRSRYRLRTCLCTVLGILAPASRRRRSLCVRTPRSWVGWNRGS